MSEHNGHRGTARGSRARIASSADSLGRLLAAAFASPVMPGFIASLSLVGIGGTMRKRLQRKRRRWRARDIAAIWSVRAIAGYAGQARQAQYRGLHVEPPQCRRQRAAW